MDPPLICHHHASECSWCRDGFLTRFRKNFEKKIAQTHKHIEDVLLELGWNNISVAEIS